MTSQRIYDTTYAANTRHEYDSTTLTQQRPSVTSWTAPGRHARGATAPNCSDGRRSKRGCRWYTTEPTTGRGNNGSEQRSTASQLRTSQWNVYVDGDRATSDADVNAVSTQPTANATAKGDNTYFTLLQRLLVNVH